MIRARRLAGLVFLAAMLLGLAAGAGAAVASGDCCAGMVGRDAASGPAAPCHSVAPTSCCEPGASGPLQATPGAPVLASCGAVHATGADRTPARCPTAAPAPAGAAALASVVLRL